MKYKLLFIPLFVACLLGCTDKENTTNDNYNCYHYELTEPLFGIVDSFIQTNKNENWLLYELYINKELSDKTQIMLVAADESATRVENTKPAMYTEVNATQVNIYSGAEKYFTSKQDSVKTLSRVTKKVRVFWKNSVFWVITASADSFTVSAEYTNLYPFLGLPMLTFKPPVFNHDKGEYE